MLSGIPRSGSQVLSSMLNQHPDVYSTITSPVADLMNLVYEQWPILNQNDLSFNEDRLKNVLNSVFQGAYKHIDKNVIVDKNRLWPRYSKLLYNILDQKPKIICTVRDIPSILSSYIILIEKNKNKISFIDQDLIDLNLPINNKNRCRILWEKYINHPYTSLRIGMNENIADLLFCTYENIVNDPQNTINKICNFIDIEQFELNPNNLQPMDENDNYHGGLSGLHEVRSQLKKTSPHPEDIIGKELTNYYQSMNLEFWNKK